jgi:hypothetical protein
VTSRPKAKAEKQHQDRVALRQRLLDAAILLLRNKVATQPEHERYISMIDAQFADVLV